MSLDERIRGYTEGHLPILTSSVTLDRAGAWLSSGDELDDVEESIIETIGGATAIEGTLRSLSMAASVLLEAHANASREAERPTAISERASLILAGPHDQRPPQLQAAASSLLRETFEILLVEIAHYLQNPSLMVLSSHPSRDHARVSALDCVHGIILQPSFHALPSWLQTQTIIHELTHRITGGRDLIYLMDSRQPLPRSAIEGIEQQIQTAINLHLQPNVTNRVTPPDVLAQSLLDAVDQSVLGRHMLEGRSIEDVLRDPEVRLFLLSNNPDIVAITAALYGGLACIADGESTNAQNLQQLSDQGRDIAQRFTRERRSPTDNRARVAQTFRDALESGVTQELRELLEPVENAAFASLGELSQLAQQEGIAALPLHASSHLLDEIPAQSPMEHHAAHHISEHEITAAVNAPSNANGAALRRSILETINTLPREERANVLQRMGPKRTYADMAGKLVDDLREGVKHGRAEYLCGPAAFLELMADSDNAIGAENLDRVINQPPVDSMRRQRDCPSLLNAAACAAQNEMADRTGLPEAVLRSAQALNQQGLLNRPDARPESPVHNRIGQDTSAATTHQRCVRVARRRAATVDAPTQPTPTTSSERANDALTFGRQEADNRRLHQNEEALRAAHAHNQTLGRWEAHQQQLKEGHAERNRELIKVWAAAESVQEAARRQRQAQKGQRAEVIRSREAAGTDAYRAQRRADTRNSAIDLRARMAETAMAQPIPFSRREQEYAVRARQAFTAPSAAVGSARAPSATWNASGPETNISRRSSSVSLVLPVVPPNQDVAIWGNPDNTGLVSHRLQTLPRHPREHMREIEREAHEIETWRTMSQAPSAPTERVRAARDEDLHRLIPAPPRTTHEAIAAPALQAEGLPQVRDTRPHPGTE
ncbi:hypothetical protein [Stenotrophomonas sp. B1-1]|uniref:hypothetical protein n=1 Tax=Stenotrophomonas sp. B1-1 TaxID=2710648 RepID=UPI0013DA91DD|nr:hypothetical protein [Stenotrophomonas sp. B1-1]